MRDAEPGLPIRLVICDDHRVLTDALALIVERDGELELVGPPLARPEDAVAVCARERPDVVLMDVQFGGAMSGIDATHLIKQASPDTHVVVMTGHEDERRLVEAVEAGASGFLNKMEPMDDVLRAVKTVAQGESIIDPAVLTRVLRQVSREREAQRQADVLLARLTEREGEILRLLGEGMRNEEIADRLVISAQTVQTHVRNILSKLRVHSRLEAVTFAARHGWLSV